MKTLRELRDDGEQHLKKAGELLGIADLLRALTANAAKVEILSPEFAEEADAAAKELYHNYDKSKAFLYDVDKMFSTTKETTIQMMNDRFVELLEHQAAAILRYKSILEEYEASEASESEREDESVD